MWEFLVIFSRYGKTDEFSLRQQNIEYLFNIVYITFKKFTVSTKTVLGHSVILTAPLNLLKLK
jgi:hypothetical protein